MKILYIGQYTHGTTSKMRSDALCEILNPDRFEFIDTHIPFYKTSKLWRTIGFRYKIGCLITETNSYVLESLKCFKNDLFDLIWVDKGVFLKPSTVKLLKEKSKKLVHFTPDMSFYINKSRLFEKAMNIYDFLITTKSKELTFYHSKIVKEKIILTTQGFSKKNHKIYHEFKDKENAICFIGLAEPHRIKVAEKILESKINLKLAGKGWSKFVAKHKHNINLTYIGETVFGDDYSKLISSCKFSIGLLSKNFPELHTTRTFEIPACGTVLLTERNKEIESFFQETDVVFYKNIDDLINKVKYFQQHNNELELIAKNGYFKVHESGYDNYSILKRVLERILT